jgi:hypothetical protein
MKVSAKSYPFPVLGNQDDIVKGQFNPSMRYTLEANEVVLNCSLQLTNPTIVEYVTDGTASFYIEVECSGTFFRKTFRSNDEETQIRIDANEVRDKVTVTFFVCANKPIELYNPEGVHPDLEGEPSFVETGDVLADGGSGWFIADKQFDPLKAPISSFMKIQKGTDKSGPMSIVYEEESIIIVLSVEDYDRYNSIRNYAPNTLHSSLVLPALVDVLYQMVQNKKQYEDKPWYGKIQQITMQRHIKLEEPITAAQQLLGQPVSRSLDEINKNSEEEV